ncbi:MAG: SH3 domain-containing protein, partial [Spirochaetota bacterium]
MIASVYARCILVVLLLFWLLGCAEERELSLPEVRALTDRPEWAVVTDGYVRVHRQAELEAPVVGHFRRGDVVTVIRESVFTDEIDGQFHRWYQIANDTLDGWVFGASIDLFDSEERAQN